MTTPDLAALSAQVRAALHDAQGPLLVAVSGGADSLALLHLLVGLRAELGLRLHAATLDHGLRGPQSAADAAYVAALAAAWDVPVTQGRAALDPQAPGVEARARTARYAFLSRAAHAIGAAHVLTAHHADDQAETLLLHLTRGTGLSGLRGMLPESPLPGDPTLTLRRPLLGATRAQLRAYCAAQDIQPREDPSNSDPRYARTLIRHQVLPALAEINPAVTDALLRLAQHARDADTALGDALESALRGQQTRTPGRWTVTRATFAALPAALKRRWLFEAVAALADDSGEAAALQHIDAALAVAESGRVGAVAQFPGGRRLRVDYDHLAIERADLPLPQPAIRLKPGQTVPVAAPGVTRVRLAAGTDWTLHLVRSVDSAALHLPIGVPLTLRTRRPGDRFDGGKLKDWFIAQRVPVYQRDGVPLLVAGSGEADAVILALLLSPTALDLESSKREDSLGVMPTSKGKHDVSNHIQAVFSVNCAKYSWETQGFRGRVTLAKIE